MAADSEAQRLQFILEGQQHADHYLRPLADPAGKSVLVLGSGAGTDVLWALRHGAREVVGLDVLEQDPGAFLAGADRFGLDPSCASFRCMDLRDAGRLGRRFDLVLANNVFEHVAGLEGAFAACAEVVEPGHGRLAIFSAPLYYSSGGSHLPTDPWEHLWGEPRALRERLLAGRLPPGHALEDLDLTDYLDREICLNRARLADYLEAIRCSGLTLLHLSVLPDRCLSELPRYLEAIRSTSGLEVADLAIEGFAVELVRPPESSAGVADYRPVAQLRLDAERRQLGEEMAAIREDAAAAGREAAAAREALEVARAEAAALRRQIAGLRQDVAQLRGLLVQVEESWSFRIGRTVTAPGRWIRSRWPATR